ncbi:MAG TPA: hypothetical protein VFP72_04355 [Kineosporiaceae bacterium]|nr:hypothetical protein [Kineosporiaceae bacterium]
MITQAPALRRPVRAALAGAAAAVVVLLLRREGLLAGTPALALAAVGVLAVPTSAQLSRRILWAGCLLAGWLPVLWWWPLPTAGLGRVSWLLAGLAGGLAAWVAAGPVRPRVARLRPGIAAADLAGPATALLGAWVLQAWLTVSTPVQALAVQAVARDGGPHFAIALAVRRGGAAVAALPDAPDGSAWFGAAYPQPFHLLVTAICEVVWGPVAGSPVQELVRETRAVALLLCAGAGVVAAGIVSLPVLRRRPAPGLAAAGVAAGSLLFGPGAQAVWRGHWPFLLTVMAGIADVLAGLQAGPRIRPLPVAAVGAAVVAVAHGWGLLGAVAVPAAALALLPASRRRWRMPRATAAVCLVIALAAVLAALDVLRWLKPEDSGALASSLGWVQVEPPPVLALVFGGGVVAAAVLRYRSRPPAPRVGGSLLGPRLFWAGAVPVTGTAAVAVLLALEIRSTGSVGYYGAKLLAGVFLVTVPVVAVQVAHLTADLVPAGAIRGRTGPAGALPRRLAGPVAALAAGVAAVTGCAAVGGGTAGRDQWLARRDHPGGQAADLLRAARVQDGRPFGTVLYLPAGRNASGVYFSDGWFTAVTGTASSRRVGLPAGPDPAAWSDPGRVGGEVAQYLRADPSREVVTTPQGLDRLRRAVGDPSLAARVVTWPDA